MNNDLKTLKQMFKDLRIDIIIDSVIVIMLSYYIFSSFSSIHTASALMKIFIIIIDIITTVIAVINIIDIFINFIRIKQVYVQILNLTDDIFDYYKFKKGN